MLQNPNLSDSSLLDPLDILLDAGLVRLLLSSVVESNVGRWDSTAGSGLDLSLELPATDLPLSAIGVPDPKGPEGDVDEAWDEEEERNSSVEPVTDGTLHGGETSTTRDTHDKETGGSSGVSTKTGGTENEDDWVHDAHTVETSMRQTIEAKPLMDPTKMRRIVQKMAWAKRRTGAEMKESKAVPMNRATVKMIKA